jgi:hypothetical protein
MNYFELERGSEKEREIERGGRKKEILTLIVCKLYYL